MLGSVFPDVLLFDTQLGFRARLLCLSLQFPLQPGRTDAGAILEFQAVRTELLGSDFDRELAGLLGWIDDMKSIYTRTDGIIYPDILYVHTSLLS